MNTTQKFIDKDQFLGAVLNNIPTNTILLKNITGIGATYLELTTKRNSIIIEPYLPVIDGKTMKHNTAFAIYEGITVKKIKKYLQNSKIEDKKLITTPESFKKVIDALMELKIDFLNEYFILFDEFEKMASDADFREKITYPMNLFFKFKGKALVSATGYIPSDPRFKQNNFEMISIIPTYEITRDLKLITTNSVLDVFKKHLKSLKSKKTFIFFNSPANISDYIKTLDIENESAIFTSVEEVNDFYDKRKDINPAHLGHRLDEAHYKKYNFLTSRYFCAMDIDIKEEVDVIILSDIIIAPHTKINPVTDAIQIPGRFRKKNVIRSFTVISNLDPLIKYKNEDECKGHLTATVDLLQKLNGLKKSSSDPHTKELINTIIKMADDTLLINDDLTPNYFMWDNFIEKNQVDSCYVSKETLTNKYKSLSIPDTEKKYFNVIGEHCIFLNSKEQMNKIKTSFSFKEKLEQIIILLNNIQETKKRIFQGEFIMIDQSEELSIQIRERHPEIFDIFHNEGEKELRKHAKSLDKLKKYHKLNYKNEHLDNFPIVKELYSFFEVGKTYTQQKFLDDFHKIAKKHNPDINRNIHEVKCYFKITESKPRINGKQIQHIKIDGLVYKIDK